MDEIRERILGKLSETEDTYGVRIPFAIESGSRGWGFASPDSDYDCRFIYVRAPHQYISVFDERDVIEYKAGPVFDINGWDLKKVIAHLVKSNAVLLEWLSCDVIYRKEQVFVSVLQQLGQQFFNPASVSHHYLSLAKHSFERLVAGEPGRIKTYFYVLRPLANLEYVRLYGQMPPMAFPDTLAAISLEPDIVEAITALLEAKQRAQEGDPVALDPVLFQYFKDKMAFFEAHLKTIRFEKCRDYESADADFRRLIKMTWCDG